MFVSIVVSHCEDRTARYNRAMNPKLMPIFRRRSVRRFTKRNVSDAQIRDLLEAAMAAPSAVATDPWRFIVVRSAETRNRIADGLPHGQMLRHAPVGIVVLGAIERAHGRLESYLLQDVSAAIENLLLAASMLGLGACWLGVHPRADRIAHIRELFQLPPNIIPVSVVAVGHPAVRPRPRTRYRAAYVHHERW